MAHGRVAGAPNGAAGRAPASNSTASGAEGSATHSRAPLVAFGGAKQGS